VSGDRNAGTLVEEINVAGTFLGMVPSVEFAERELHLSPSDRLITYTDGICEQENADGRPFGIEGMIELLSERPRDADEVVRDLDRAVTNFTRGRPLGDDMVLLCVEFAGERRSMVSFGDASEYNLKVT
jgi:sigma-B regulation protein RsbU (phosphoserine phosphatase)